MTHDIQNTGHLSLSSISHTRARGRSLAHQPDSCCADDPPAVNVPHNYVEQGKTVGALVAHAQAIGANRVEVTEEAESAWVNLILTAPQRRMMDSCTPGYYNGEGKEVPPELQNVVKKMAGYPKGALAYFKYLQQWRAADNDKRFEGIEFSRVATPA